MRKTDLSPDRQQLLAPLDSHPGALALVPPPTPTHLQLPGLRGEIARAHEALGRLQASAASLPNPNLVTRTLDRREAVRSSQIEGTSSGIDDVLTFGLPAAMKDFPPMSWSPSTTSRLSSTAWKKPLKTGSAPSTWN